MDADFKEFMNLSPVFEIQHKSTLKVIYIISSPVEPCITLYTEDSFEETSSTTCSEPETPALSLALSCSDDMLYTSTPHSSPETQLSLLSPWPKVFQVPKFTHKAEFELHQKNTEFETNGTYFNPGPKLKWVILDGLAQEIMKYTKDYQCEEVAAALTRVHLCLMQLGSKTGFWGWISHLGIKCKTIKLGWLGHPEIHVNSLKHKREAKEKLQQTSRNLERLKWTTFRWTQKVKQQKVWRMREWPYCQNWKSETMKWWLKRKWKSPFPTDD